MSARVSDSMQRRAEQAALRYVSPGEPGFGRRRCGRGFTYIGRTGRTLSGKKTRQRLTKLAIPPAWVDVWICADHRGHIQATGLDAKKRKQYIYQPRWHEIGTSVKFERLMNFASRLPFIRQSICQDLARPAADRQRVVAAVVRILDQGHLRVGNPEYTATSGARGATTLTAEHAAIDDTLISLDFPGKGGKRRRINLNDPEVAAVISECGDIGRQFLFSYETDDGEIVDIDSGAVNDYIRRCAGQTVSAKDFRTWWGSVHALAALRTDRYGVGPDPRTLTARRSRVQAAMKKTAEQLGNTPAICRTSYVHPGIVEAALSGNLQALFNRKNSRKTRQLNRNEGHFAHFLATV